MYELISKKKLKNNKKRFCGRYSGPPNNLGVRGRCNRIASQKVSYRYLTGDPKVDAHPLINQIHTELICDECFEKVYRKNDG